MKLGAGSPGEGWSSETLKRREKRGGSITGALPSKTGGRHRTHRQSLDTLRTALLPDAQVTVIVRVKKA